MLFNLCIKSMQKSLHSSGYSNNIPICRINNFVGPPDSSSKPTSETSSIYNNNIIIYRFVLFFSSDSLSPSFHYSRNSLDQATLVFFSHTVTFILVSPDDSMLFTRISLIFYVRNRQNVHIPNGSNGYGLIMAYGSGCC